ncbi:sigma-70 family RNA polymerase sigma factor [Marinoscillum sp. MHG1-6]|uniref:sigma-70 family RNA polymerase sigma factor n=1 Tax=Marinoscillum sp. MHG1-6 TaxID=2959627 RepID=UPI00215791C3|nr:sigma-70 family RNA polymerase sigma factor [Marinoscillum sp. MHG1-6]
MKKRKPEDLDRNSSDHLFTSWFKDVYSENFEKLFRYAFSITKDEQLAEDAVSEVFSNIWEHRPDHHSIKEVKAYLHVSVKHLAIRMISRDAKQFSYSSYDESLQVSDAIDPESLLLGKELEAIINRVVERLTPHAKLVYELAKMKGYSNQQIADELGVSKRTVEAHLYTTVKSIREALIEHFRDSGHDHMYISKMLSLSMGLLGSMLMSTT